MAENWLLSKTDFEKVTLMITQETENNKVKLFMDWFTCRALKVLYFHGRKPDTLNTMLESRDIAFFF